MNEYELTYEVVGSGGGTVKETVTAASDMNARNLIYAKYRGQTVRIIGSRQTNFGGGRDDRRNDRR